MAPTRFSLVLIAVFAIVAAVLAGVGLYGVLSTAVRQRTAEIGVRMAFGATAQSIFRLMIGQGMVLSGIGIAGGLVAAFALTGVMQRADMLVSIKPTDPLTYAAIALLFAAIAALACWVPSRRAASLDPNVALRGVSFAVCRNQAVRPFVSVCYVSVSQLLWLVLALGLARHDWHHQLEH